MHFKTYSGDETTERRDAPSGRESKSSGRFGGEFRDSDEAPKRQEKEFRFDVDKTKSTSGKPTKKVDLGAAAFYKADPIPSSVSVINTNARVLIPLQTICDFQNPAVSKSTNENGSSDLLADVFGNAGTATTTAANTATSNASCISLISAMLTAEQMATLVLFPVPSSFSSIYQVYIINVIFNW